MRYVLNSAVITAPGLYRYRLISPEDATRWLTSGPFTSAIGYGETAQALSELTVVPISVDRRVFTMSVGDEALVFRLVFPPGTPRVQPGQKGALGRDFIRQHSEIGLLVRKS